MKMKTFSDQNIKKKTYFGLLNYKWSDFRLVFLKSDQVLNTGQEECRRNAGGRQ